MNTPIIDPMLFYWMNILNNLAQLPFILILVLLVYFFWSFNASRLCSL